jgi:magnesium transporter
MNLLRDTGSLLTHTAFSFERLEFLQNTFLGLINIEQILPELEWALGYPFAILLMLASSGFTMYYFRRKDWL